MPDEPARGLLIRAAAGAPTTQLSTLSGTQRRGGRSGAAALFGWSRFVEEGETTPELKWPISVRVYERMMTDGQVDSLFWGTCSPLIDYVWWVEPGKADKRLAELFAEDVGLPVGEPDDDEWEPPGPGVARFNFLEHLQEALLALVFGHYYFEQIGAVMDGLWRLAKLAPIHPATIASIDTDDTGGLMGVSQHGYIPMRLGNGQPAPQLTVDRIVGYVWRGDARRRWIGRSMFRSMYASYLIKDVLQRVDAINHERAGGIPGFETDETYAGANLDDLASLASQIRVDEEGGWATPPGVTAKLLRAGGTDVVGSMRYHDEIMARIWSGMVRQLGSSQTGSRALGGTFDVLEERARRMIGRWFRLVFREHVIEDWWNWNVEDPLAVVPTLACRPFGALKGGRQALPSTLPEAPQEPPGAPQAAPAAPGAPPGTPAPAAAPPATPPAAPAAARPAARPPARPAATRAAAEPPRYPAPLGLRPMPRLPSRALRREPNEAEVRAAVDFAALERAYVSAGASIADVFQQSILPDAITDLTRQLTRTRVGERRQRLTAPIAAGIEAPVHPPADVVDQLTAAARVAADGAASEAVRQGVDVVALDNDSLIEFVSGIADALTQNISSGLTTAARRKATQMVAGRSPSEVAAAVETYLRGLAHQWEVDQINGAVQAAQTGARILVWQQVPDEQPVHYQASELLDENTCSECSRVDGRVYGDLRAAMRAYPFGGYMDCRGGPRCRGTIVAVFDEGLTASAPLAAYSPGEPRDYHGRWTSGPGGRGPVMKEIDDAGLNDWPKPTAADKKVLGGHNDTQSKHATVSEGRASYSKQRMALHNKIIGKHLTESEDGKPVGVGAVLGKGHPTTKKLSAGGVLTEREKQTVRDAAAHHRGGGKPQALFMAGGPASGKSSALKHEAGSKLVPDKSLTIDPDRIKGDIPEYKAMVGHGSKYAASGAHEESSDVAKRLTSEAQDLGLNVVVDGTGDSKPGKFPKKIEAVRDKGYDVSALYVTAPTDVAVERAVARARRSGRWVPEPEIRLQHKNVSVNFGGVREVKGMKALTVIDNTGEAVEIAHWQNGKLVVTNHKLFRAFEDKAKE